MGRTTDSDSDGYWFIKPSQKGASYKGLILLRAKSNLRCILLTIVSVG